MRISDWSSDVCSSDLPNNMDYVSFLANTLYADAAAQAAVQNFDAVISLYQEALPQWRKIVAAKPADANSRNILAGMLVQLGNKSLSGQDKATANGYYKEATELARKSATAARSEEHTSELQSLMRISYAVFCLKKKNKQK